MKQCDRCREIKDDFRFRLNQKSWHALCIRCEKTPVGKMPIRETDEHVWRGEECAVTDGI